MIDRELTKEEKGELTKQFMAAAIAGLCANPDFSDNTYDKIAKMAFEQAVEATKQLANYFKP